MGMKSYIDGLSPAPIGGYDLDESSGTSFAATGTLPTLTKGGTPTLGATGVDGTAVTFSGSGQYAYNSTTGPFATFPSAFTFVIAVKGSAQNNKKIAVIGYAGSSSFGLRTGNASPYTKIGVFWYNGAVPLNVFSSTDGWLDDEWHDVAVRYDAGSWSLWIDGVSRGTGSYTIPGSTACTGLILAASSPSSSEYFAGTLDNVRVFDRALSDAEILGIHEARSPLLTGGTLTRTCRGNTSTTFAISTATGGISPYTYRLHRSTTNGFTPSGASAGSGTCVAVSSVAGEIHDPGPLTEGTTYYYVLQTVDSLPTTALSSQFTHSTKLSFSKNAAGFYAIPVDGSARLVYCSSSAGNDANDGLSEGQAKATLSAAIALLRDGQPDRLRLKRGDTWTDQNLGDLGAGGASAINPWVIEGYGTGARPVVKLPASTAAWSLTGATNNLAILGIKFYGWHSDPTQGAEFTDTKTYGASIISCNDWLIEDCVFYYTSPLIQSSNRITLRRNVIEKPYGTATHVSGLYEENSTVTTFEENVLDHCGWDEDVPAATATVYKHGMYLNSTNSDTRVVRNIIYKPSNFGIQARSGGYVGYNIIVKAPNGLSFGQVNGSPVKTNGVSGIVESNCIIEGRDLNGVASNGGINLDATRVNGFTRVRYNILANNAQHSSAGGISLLPGTAITNAAEHPGLNDVTISENIVYGWEYGIVVFTGYTAGGTGQYGLNNIAFTSNKVQNTVGYLADQQMAVTAEIAWSENNYYDATAAFRINSVAKTFAQWVSDNEADAGNLEIEFPAPERTLAAYATANSYASEAALVAALDGRTEGEWPSDLAAATIQQYFENGFTDSAAPTAAMTDDEGTPLAGIVSLSLSPDGDRYDLWLLFSDPSEVVPATIGTQASTTVAVTIVRTSDELPVEDLANCDVYLNALGSQDTDVLAHIEIRMTGGELLPPGTYEVRINSFGDPATTPEDAAGNAMTAGTVVGTFVMGGVGGPAAIFDAFGGGFGF